MQDNGRGRLSKSELHGWHSFPQVTHSDVHNLEAFRPPVHDPVTSDDLKSLVGAGVSMALALIGFSLNIGGLIFVSLVVALWALKKSWGNR